MTGRTISHYKILEKLGEGGMGLVYKARDTQLDRDVALKVLPADAVADPAARSRLMREARLASKLNHPHICTIYEVGESDGQVFVAMELVEGQTLSARLAAGALPVEEVLRFGLQLTDALAHAHKRGVIHRDLKSANIVITPEGRAKVLDFGLAKRLKGETGEDATTLTQDTVTSTGVVAGTPAYMSPEQFRGQPVDARSDIWALGVMLYEMASGARPFRGTTAFELSSAILNQPPSPLPPGPGGAPPLWLRSLIERCLEKEPARRYQSSDEVRASLETVQAGVTLKVWLAWKYGLSRRRWLALAAVVVAVLGVSAALDVGGIRSRLVRVIEGQKYHSLAVLPVANLTGDPAQEYFADGMTATLIANISKIGALRVMSRTSVMRYKGAKKSLPEIARELKVDTVLEASVTREANRVRLTAQLIEAATDRNLWAETYERELAGILWVQSEVARAVARTVRARLTPQQETRLVSKREVNPAAYEAYLKGIFYLNQDTREGNQKGMASLLEALENDPADPMAYAQLASGYIALAHGAEPPEDALPRAKAAVRPALELDNNLAEALAASGMLKCYDDWDWEGGIRDVQRALEINPSLANAHYHLAWFYVLLGRYDEAITEHKRAQELDPLMPQYTSQFALLYRHIGRYEEAIKEAQKVIEIYPKGGVIAHWALGLVHQDRGRYSEAIAELQKSAAVSPSWKWAVGPAYALAGRTAEARSVLAELKQQKINRWHAYWLAQTYAALGEKDEAFRWLNYEHPHIWVPWLLAKRWPYMNSLRDDPRFRELQVRMHVPQ
jgi:serine/threonine-protein kinase